MSRPRKLPPGTCLHNDTDGLAGIVVEPGQSPAFALAEAVLAYTGAPAYAEHPVIRRYAESLPIRRWRYCTFAWREFEGHPDTEDYPSWWAENGDGKTAIYVADLSDLEIWAIGEQIEDAEVRS